MNLDVAISITILKYQTDFPAQPFLTVIEYTQDTAVMQQKFPLMMKRRKSNLPFTVKNINKLANIDFDNVLPYYRWVLIILHLPHIW